jgi:hypothetical protein
VINDLSLVSWTAINVIAQAVSDMPTVTRASLLAKLKTMSAVKTGTTPVLDFTKPGPVPGLPRVVNTYLTYITSNGTQWDRDGKLVSMAGFPAIDGMTLGAPPQS